MLLPRAWGCWHRINAWALWDSVLPVLVFPWSLDLALVPHLVLGLCSGLYLLVFHLVIWCWWLCIFLFFFIRIIISGTWYGQVGGMVVYYSNNTRSKSLEIHSSRQMLIRR